MEGLLTVGSCIGFSGKPHLFAVAVIDVFHVLSQRYVLLGDVDVLESILQFCIGIGHLITRTRLFDA